MNRKLNIIYAAPNRRRERRNNMKLKKLASLALAGALTLGLLPAFSSPALADGETTTDYVLTIPSSLTVTKSGWNEQTDGISATGTLESGKKLTVTASSANSWALKSGDNSVGYTLTTAEGGSQTTSWEFTTLDGTAQGLGIIVENYDNKPAGTYTDTVTFTASVGAAAPLYYDKAVQVYRYDNPGYRDYVYSGNYKTLSADEGYALAQYFASVNSCSVCVITDWIDSSGQMKYVTNSSSAEQQSTPSFFGRYDRVYLVPKN